MTVSDLGLALRVDDNQRPDEKVPAGGIMQQDPAPGVAARRQRTIRVWVSSGPRATTVPGLVGQTERTARMRLDQDGLEVASVSEFRSPDYPADAVVAQDPPPSARGAARVAAAQPRRTGHDLRDARRHRHRTASARPKRCARAASASPSSARSRTRACRRARSCGSSRPAGSASGPATRSRSR